MNNIKTNMKFQSINIVNDTMLASSVGSGSLDVFATPMMILFIEQLASDSVQMLLSNNLTSVGTNVSVDHVSATPSGLEVTTKLEITEINGREIVFGAEVYDEKGLIGKGTHKRFVVDKEKFMLKTNSKLNNN